MYKTGIIGATGYTGSELVRLLVNHDKVKLEVITSESHEGKRFSDIHKQFVDVVDIPLVRMDQIDDYDLDLVFLALPHGISQEFVRKNQGKKYRIIDLSADFRLSSAEVYEKWYHTTHTCPEFLSKAIFGLPEFFRKEIQQSDFVANPGCFVTSVILAAAPLIKEGLVDPCSVLADSKTGVTGAGIKPSAVTHFSNVNDNFKAYGLKHHRHTVEMQEALSSFTGEDVQLLFTPHLLPVDRGILSTVYYRPKGKIVEEKLVNLFKKFYKEEPFVRIVDHMPEIKSVRGSNYCDIKVIYDERTHTVVTISTLDNLVKGASGQAVQNMNIMLGLDECEGLQYLPLHP